MNKPLRVALYLRVSTGEQTTENQQRELTQLAEQRGWPIVATYEDAGISGSKGRDKRPGLDRMLKDAVRGKFDVVLCWALDRIGRSLIDLLSTLKDLESASVALVLHQQAIDTTTPSGRMLFQMTGVFAEFERAMIQARVLSGMARAKAKGIRIGRPTISREMETRVRDMLATGTGINKTARLIGVGVGTVARIKAAAALPS